MKRISIAGCAQEVSTFNPVLSTYENFSIARGDEIFERSKGKNSEIDGAVNVLRGGGDIEVVASYMAGATSAGPLDRDSWDRIAGEFLDALKPFAGQIQGAYFAMRGSMSAENETDPEGYLLEKSREILGSDIPITISQDIHGVVTAKMLKHIDGVAVYHTYPHVDFADTGARAAHQLLRMINDGARPVTVRLPIPALVRGKQLITETGLFGNQVRYLRELHGDPRVLNAGFQIGNPFTDVPELCSQVIVVTDNDEKFAREIALKAASEFWDNRYEMHAELIGLEEAVAKASKMKGPIEFTDAADAPSSGASGDSNAIVAEMIRTGYRHTVLAPIVDASAVVRAVEKGIGGKITVKLGGSLDRRFTPVEVKATVVSISDGIFALEIWPGTEHAGPTAVLESGNYTFVVFSRSVNLVDRAPFFANGLDPKDFHSIIVKSPFCEPEFFDDWCEINLNVEDLSELSALGSFGAQTSPSDIRFRSQQINI
ncbi:MAG: M81 family metallopeptidase [Chloroflexi bacterium]|nr:M81 family metallopeptidase [Chloroflexota bacterium]